MKYHDKKKILGRIVEDNPYLQSLYNYVNEING